MDQVRRLVAQGQLDIPRVGSVTESGQPGLPSLVVDGDGMEVVAVSVFLRDLMVCDMSAATCRSYAHDLLRWFGCCGCWRWAGIAPRRPRSR
jgi:hypothetical protein